MRHRGLPALLALLAAVAVGQDRRDLRIESVARLNPLEDTGTRWAVVVGISAYQNLPPGAQLQFAHRDGQDFAAFLRGRVGGALPPEHIRFLSNEQATLAQIRAALHTWLPASAGPQDIVYFFFAGHGVVDDQEQGYFVAHDSDPQNLHATALSFDEVDAALSREVRAGLVVLIADACHTGRLGWSSFQASLPSRAAQPLERIGQADRSFLKMLGSRPSEGSYEDPKLDGGHGIFTHTLLTGLIGDADRDGDHVVRASEAIDYVSRRVPELTAARQHPRVAGNFDARLALAAMEVPAPVRVTSLDVFGPARSSIYIDNTFRGMIRPEGSLRVEAVVPGAHLFAADFPDGSNLHGSVTLSEAPARVNIAPPPASALAQLRDRINAGRVLEPAGAWDYYRNQTFPVADRAAASALIGGALEELGQTCVGDYVQSTVTGLKRAMLSRAVDAFERLQTLRPGDGSVEVRKQFCRGRLLIAENRFGEAVTTLESVAKLDPRFACAYNALGVALGRVNRPKEAREAFETAAKLTPEWGLPPFQIASQLVAAGEPAKAVPYLEKAVTYNPRSITNRWNLVHALRLANSLQRAEREATELIRLSPNYAPVYVELAQVYEAAGDSARAADALDTYVLLAPNYSDTAQVREHAARLRKPAPSLRR
jgi:Flp pilus assembly protein TadD